VPELPEVQALVDFLRERTNGLAIVGVELGSISVLKTYDPAPSSLIGLPVSDVARHGKFIDIEAEGLDVNLHAESAYDFTPAGGGSVRTGGGHSAPVRSEEEVTA